MVVTTVGKRAAPSLQFVHCCKILQGRTLDCDCTAEYCWLQVAQQQLLIGYAKTILAGFTTTGSSSSSSYSFIVSSSLSLSSLSSLWLSSSSSYSYIIVIIIVIVITIVIATVLLLLLHIIIRSHLLTLVVGEERGFDRCSWKITIWIFIIIVIIIIVIIYRSSLSSLNVDVMKTL